MSLEGPAVEMLRSSGLDPPAQTSSSAGHPDQQEERGEAPLGLFNSWFKKGRRRPVEEKKGVMLQEVNSTSWNILLVLCLFLPL